MFLSFSRTGFSGSRTVQRVCFRQTEQFQSSPMRDSLRRSFASSEYRGTKEYVTNWQTGLCNNPLVQLKEESVSRGIANCDGSRLQGAPWAFQLTCEGDDAILGIGVKTVGFQRVSELGIDFLLARKALTLQSSVSSPRKVALCSVNGIYPPLKGSSCEQWRAEGYAHEIPVSSIMQTAPIGSFAQLVAKHRWQKKSVDGGRTSLADGAIDPSADDTKKFIASVERIKQELNAGSVSEEEIALACAVWRLIPERMELLISGEVIWERFEWHKTGGGNPGEIIASEEIVPTFSGPNRLLPY